MHALLYEYEQDLEDLLSYWLRQEQFTLTVAKTGEDFFQFCRKGSPQLLILGTCPPNMLQSDVADQIRQIPEANLSHLLILTTSTLFCHQVNSANRDTTTCICTPTAPRVLRETFHQIREKLEKPTTNDMGHATASI